MAGGLGLLFGQAGPGDFRVGVDDRGHGAVVDLALLAVQLLGQNHAFLDGLVRQHGAADDVAHGVDAFGAGLVMRVGLDEAALVELHAGNVAAQVLGVGAAADGDDQLVEVDRLLLAVLLVFDGDVLLAGLGAQHLGAELDVQSLLGQLAQPFLGDGLVDHRQEARQGFEDGGLGAEARPDAAQLHADDASADDAEGARHFGEFQGAPGIDDAVLVDRRDLQVDRLGAGGDDDVFGAVGLFLAVVRLVADLAAAEQLAEAEQAGDLVALEQHLDAAGVGLAHRVAARLHFLQVQLDLAYADAVHGELVLGAVVQLGRFEQGLGGDAAGIEAGAAEGLRAVGVDPAVDAQRLHAQLGSADRRGVAAGTAADDDDVVVFAHFLFHWAARRIVESRRGTAGAVRGRLARTLAQKQ